MKTRKVRKKGSTMRALRRDISLWLFCVFLVGSDKTEEVLKLVEANCQERSIETEVLEYNGHMMVDVQKTIVIGGATVFILGLSQLIKIKGGVNVKY